MNTPCGQVFTVRFADVSPGVGSLVGGELSQSLGARLLVSALRAVGATFNQDSTCFFSYDNQINSLIVLCFNCDISDVLFYDVYSS